MHKPLKLCLAALGLGVTLATPALAEGIIVPPFKVDFSFRFNIRSTAQPQPTAPWWAYFPQDPHEQQPSNGHAYPNWPTQFPPAQTAAPRVAPNVTHGYTPTAVQPVGMRQGPAPSYWYAR